MALRHLAQELKDIIMDHCPPHYAQRFSNLFYANLTDEQMYKRVWGKIFKDYRWISQAERVASLLSLYVLIV
jgi:hypothetical protein